MNLFVEQIRDLEDIYLFLIWNEETGQAVIVDPAVPQPALTFLKERSLTPVAILNTHHHPDHVGGNLSLQKVFPKMKIFGAKHDSARIPGITDHISEGEELNLLGVTWKVIDVKGHTLGHIAYHVNQPFVHLGQCQFNHEGRQASGELFIGDTLFGGGCGKLFEGSYADMLVSLNRLQSLPDSTRLWCAHEYTEKNLWVARKILPKDSQLEEHYQQVVALRKEHLPTVPLSLEVERKINPFLRSHDPAVQASVGQKNEIDTFRALRDFRDQF